MLVFAMQFSRGAWSPGGDRNSGAATPRRMGGASGTPSKRNRGRRSTSGDHREARGLRPTGTVDGPSSECINWECPSHRRSDPTGRGRRAP
jgi:hypothetical protein